MLKFLYLNIYSLLLVIVGFLILLLPLYKINIWLLVIQIIVAINFFIVGGRLFATYHDKKRMINILLTKNRNKFQPETFKEYMQAPCGRLVVRIVLSELDKSNEYRNLLKLKKSTLTNIKENCKPIKTVVYIKDEE